MYSFQPHLSQFLGTINCIENYSCFQTNFYMNGGNVQIKCNSDHSCLNVRILFYIKYTLLKNHVVLCIFYVFLQTE